MLLTALIDCSDKAFFPIRHPSAFFCLQIFHSLLGLKIHGGHGWCWSGRNQRMQNQQRGRWIYSAFYHLKWCIIILNLKSCVCSEESFTMHFQPVLKLSTKILNALYESWYLNMSSRNYMIWDLYALWAIIKIVNVLSNFPAIYYTK